MRKSLARLLSFLIGAVLLLTAIGKLLDNRGFATVLAAYESFPSWALLSLGLSVSLAELFLALWLFWGRRLRLAAIIALFMHLAYMLWSAASILRGLKLENCGCFGVFWVRPLGWSTVVEDAVLSCLCLALVFLATPRKSDDLHRLR